MPFASLKSARKMDFLLQPDRLLVMADEMQELSFAVPNMTNRHKREGTILNFVP
jgi:hypothetical protein